MIAIAEDDAAAAPPRSRSTGALDAAHIAARAAAARGPSTCWCWAGTAARRRSSTSWMAMSGRLDAHGRRRRATEAERELAERCAGVQQRQGALPRRAHRRSPHARRRWTSRAYDQVIVLCYSEQLDVQTRGRAHAGHAAAPARLADRARQHLLDRQRDARRPQPHARAGDQGRRRDRQRPADQPADRPRSPRTHARRGVRRAVHRRGLGDLPAAGRPTTSAPATRTNFATIVEAARRRGETAIGYRVQPRPTTSRRLRRAHQPAQVGAGNLREDDRVIVLARSTRTAVARGR